MCVVKSCNHLAIGFEYGWCGMYEIVVCVWLKKCPNIYRDGNL